MNKTFRSIIFLLLLPSVIVAMFLETRLQLSTVGHDLVQVGIICAACWLAWRWVVYDEMSNLKESRRTDPSRYHYRIPALREGGETHQPEPISQPRNGTVKEPAGRMALFDKNAYQALTFPMALVRVAHVLKSVGVVFTLTVVMLLIGSKTLGEGVIAILYLVPIGWCTVRWGQLAGVSAGLTAAMAFDFLFIPPYGTFNIGSLEGWLLLFLFIATAILVVGRVQTILMEGHQRERKATFLYEMVAAIANQPTHEGICRAIANQVQQNFQAEGVQVHLMEGYGHPSFTARVGIGQVSASSRIPDRALAIVSGAALIGEIDIWQGRIPLPYEEDPMLQTMLSQVGAALDRARVAEGKPPYPKQKPSYSEGNSLQTSPS